MQLKAFFLVAFFLVGSLALSVAEARHGDSEFTRKEIRALGKRVGVLGTNMRGSEISGGNKKDNGGLMMLIFEKDNDYNIYYRGMASLTTAGTPTTITVNKGGKGSDGAIVFDFSLDAEWKNETRTAVVKAFQKRYSYEYQFEGIYKKVSTKPTATTETLKGLVEDMLKDADGYYAVVGTAAKVAGVARGQFNGRKKPAIFGGN